MDTTRSPPSRPKDNDDRISPERKEDGDEATNRLHRQGLKRPASLIDVSENTNSTNESARLTSRSERLDEEDEDIDDDVLDADMSPTKLASLSRSERKRYREKKRRSDVNKGFEDLMSLLLEIDPQVRAEAEERARRGQWKGALGSQEDNLLSRVDLISRTVHVMRRLHEENEQRKLIIDQLVQENNRRDSQHLGRNEPQPSISFSSGSSGGANESLSRLVAERVQQEAVLNRLNAQRQLLQGQCLNFLRPNDIFSGNTFNPTARSQDLGLPSNDLLSMLESARNTNPTGFGSANMGLSAGTGGFCIPHPADLHNEAVHPLNIPRELLQQLNAAQLQQLLRENVGKGHTRAPDGS